MSRPFPLIAAAALATGLSFTAAQAQDETERYNQVIVYGDDPCPQS